MRRGPLIILSGPSGSGKSTVIKRLLPAFEGRLRLSVSATTRKKRRDETEGVDYYFWSCEQFLHEVAVEGFLEWAEVHGNHYGTLRSEVEAYRAQGTGVLLDIDVQGAAQVRSRCPDHVSVFLMPSTMAILEQRLRKRGTEAEASILRRLGNARIELTRVAEYDYQVENDELEKAVAELTAIIETQYTRGT